MENRSKHTYRTTLYAFADRVLVACPNCAGKALVVAGDFHTPSPNISRARVVCTACGFNKTMDKLSKRQEPKQKRGRILVFGGPIDPFFHLPVWLQLEFKGEILWAYNHEHLDFLEQHVGAKLRERNGFPFRIKSIGARLPRWMTSAAHRDEILRAIEKLRKK